MDLDDLPPRKKRLSGLLYSEYRLKPWSKTFGIIREGIGCVECQLLIYK